jgi:predicted nicotinamide N-methyase
MMAIPPILDRRAFILAETRLHQPPYVPEITLHLADEAVTLWQRTEDELGEMGLPPPFWAFAWAGGQALARYILNDGAFLKGRHVLDFASGSGLVAIAAAKAGASHVVAADIDPFALCAIELNAEENRTILAIEGRDLIGKPFAGDVILAGDICYQRDIAERVISWLVSENQRGVTVLIGDPGRSYLPKDQLECLATYDVPVTRALEDGDIKRSSVWCFRSSPDPRCGFQ